jgi:hypothetical protein
VSIPNLGSALLAGWIARSETEHGAPQGGVQTFAGAPLVAAIGVPFFGSAQSYQSVTQMRGASRSINTTLQFVA